MTDTEKVLAKIDERIKPLEERLNILEQLVPIDYTPEDIATKPRTKDLREVKLELSFLYALRRQVEKESVEPPDAKTDIQFAIMTGYNDALAEMKREVATDLGISE